MNVLVMDGKSRKTLPIIRSLGQRGVDVTLGEETGLCFSRFSRYCGRFITYPSPKEQPQDFINFLVRELRRRQYGCIIPVADETVLAVVKHKDQLSRYTAVPFPDLDVFLKAANKENTMKIARKHGIPCPKTISLKNLSELGAVEDELVFPVVLKPRISYGSRGIRYVRKREDFMREYRALHSLYEYPLIQEYIPTGGDAYGLSALFDANSKPIVCFVHRRSREYPLTGGPSTMRESVSSPEIMDLGVRILQAMGWYGIAMVEFKVDPRDNIPKLMEVNPRFWGSLPLAILAGVDFPYLLYQMASGEKLESLTSYTIGTKCRWLLPGDLLNFLSNLKRGNLDLDFFRFFDGTGYDIISLQDPMPIFGFFISSLLNLFNKKMWRYVFKR